MHYEGRGGGRKKTWLYYLICGYPLPCQFIWTFSITWCVKCNTFIVAFINCLNMPRFTHPTTFGNPVRAVTSSKAWLLPTLTLSLALPPSKITVDAFYTFTITCQKSLVEAYSMAGCFKSWTSFHKQSWNIVSIPTHSIFKHKKVNCTFTIAWFIQMDTISIAKPGPIFGEIKLLTFFLAIIKCSLFTGCIAWNTNRQTLIKTPVVCLVECTISITVHFPCWIMALSLAWLWQLLAGIST